MFFVMSNYETTRNNISLNGTYDLTLVSFLSTIKKDFKSVSQESVHNCIDTRLATSSLNISFLTPMYVFCNQKPMLSFQLREIHIWRACSPAVKSFNKWRVSYIYTS